MKLNTFIATVMVVTLLAACTNNQKMNQDMKQAAFITADQTEEVIAQLKDSLGEASAFRIGRGVTRSVSSEPHRAGRTIALTHKEAA